MILAISTISHNAKSHQKAEISHTFKFNTVLPMSWSVYDTEGIVCFPGYHKDMHAAITRFHETAAADSREILLLHVFKAHSSHGKIMILFKSTNFQSYQMSLKLDGTIFEFKNFIFQYR